MTLRFALLRPPALPAGPYPSELPENEEDYDHYFCLIACTSVELGDTGYRFVAGGFGPSEWAVDTYDLSTLVEELPELLQALRRGAEWSVDMYAPGLERTLRFRPRGTTVWVSCESRTSWRPNPPDELIGHAALEDMLTTLATDYGRALKDIGSGFAELEPFPSWRSGRV
ncbi:hypothetical protein [Streptoalloteichus hindustanus]|uniref:Uncharacterized protein n=1 Tax=Streptoalloteichus hindustanus TaxID=2017 RepID=A0A1M4YWI0_STRHI|nr:hypothetical protein [Streptoalloteichus hindustanus]SHF10161.1 hypothetical protein SAMN05444320_102514 [Streptoalloteichus hindustanus]